MFAFYFFIQNIFVYSHKISFDIQLQNPALFLVIFRTGTDEVIHSLNPFCGDYFALDRLVHDEAHTPPECICAIHNILVELEQLLLISRFKSQGVGG